MALFSITDAQLAFGHVALLDHTDFALEANERVGLIGRNGTGKSSLLKIIAGLAPADDGLISRQQGLTTAYVAQEPDFQPDAKVFDVVAAGLPQAWAQLQAYEALTAKLGAPHSDAAGQAMMHELHELQTALDACDGWSLTTRVETTLNQLGLRGTQIIGELSGGTQKRVALAQALVAQPDVLLLDEPTNHLDMAAIAWLENLLLQFKGSVLLITHDRAFLDRVATRIIELDRGTLRSYPGNFSTYQSTKARQLEMEAVENAKFDKLLAQEEVWIRKGVEARRTRSVARIGRLQEMRLQRQARRDVQGNVKLDVGQAERSGKIVAELTNVSKSYGVGAQRRTIVSNFTATLMRGDKVGLIGNNGAGKTTLLKMILGVMPPDSGTVKIGSNLHIAYFDQMRAQLDMEASLADTISPGSDWVEVNGNKKHVMSYLGDFLFAPERARSPVKSLSGGERNRLLLARLFAKPANVLVLDEPTNDLDIETLELLEELLQEFDGTVFLVSHDRTFLDNVVTSVLVAEGEHSDDPSQAGVWREYVGGYHDWLTQSSRAKDLQAAQQKVSHKANRAANRESEKHQKQAATQSPASVAAKVKLSHKEQRELENLPKQISALETEQAAISAELASGEIYSKNPARAAELAARFETIEGEMLVALERWEGLETKRMGA